MKPDTSPEAQRAAIDALGRVSGWSVGPVQKRKRKHVDYLSDADEYRLELYFPYGDAGSAQVKAILAVLGNDHT